MTNAEDHLLERKTENDQAAINTLSVEDQVNFSTVTLYLYQRETTRQEVIADQKDINAYRPNIGFRIMDSLKTGWYILEAIIVFIFNLWALILLALLGYFGYRKYIANNRQRVDN